MSADIQNFSSAIKNKIGMYVLTNFRYKRPGDIKNTLLMSSQFVKYLFRDDLRSSN